MVRERIRPPLIPCILAKYNDRSPVGHLKNGGLPFSKGNGTPGILSGKSIGEGEMFPFAQIYVGQIRFRLDDAKIKSLLWNRGWKSPFPSMEKWVVYQVMDLVLCVCVEYFDA